jgi:hypothetical protein
MLDVHESFNALQNLQLRILRQETASVGKQTVKEINVCTMSRGCLDITMNDDRRCWLRVALNLVIRTMMTAAARYKYRYETVDDVQAGKK